MNIWKTSRRWWVALVAAGLLAVTSGCSGSSSGSSDSDEIRIGVLLPLSGAGASLGGLIKPAVEMAMNDANGSADMDGHKIKLYLEDNRAAAAASVSAMQKLVNVDHVTAVVSSYSDATLAVMPLAEKNHIPVIQSGAQADNLTGASPYLFNGIPSSSTESAGLMRYLATNRHVRTAAIAYLSDDSGLSTKGDMESAAKAEGIDILDSESHDFDQTDFRGLVLKLTADNPDVILMATHSKPAALLADQIRSSGYKGLIAGTTFMATPELLASDASEGLIHSTVKYDPPADWAARYRKANGSAPSIYSALYYDAVSIYAQAIEAGLKDGKKIDGDVIRDEILKIGTFTGVTGDTTFDKEGTSTKPITINVIKNHVSKPIATVDNAAS